MARQSRTHRRKIFRPYIRGAVACCGRAITTRGRLRINRARTGEKYSARTSMVRRRVAGAAIWGAAMFDGWVMVDLWRTDGRKIFRPYTCGAWLHRACATIYGVAMVMVGRRRLNRAGRGEIFFARTSVVRRRVACAGVRSQRAGDCASIAHARAKNILPVHMRCVVTSGMRHDLWCGNGDGWAIAHQWRT